jgi:AcrR family transcriptional regulator
MAVKERHGNFAPVTSARFPTSRMINIILCQSTQKSLGAVALSRQSIYVSSITERRVMATIGRPRRFDRAVALEAAMRIFWRKGFSASSMPDLCEAMGIRSPSLYAAFGSKEALYLEAIDHYAETIGPSIWNCLKAETTARTGVESMLRVGAEILPGSDDVPAGCMVMLAAVGDDWPIALAEVANRIRCGCLEHLRSRFDLAITEGELPPSTDIDRLSRFYLGVYQGMAIQAKDSATEAELRGVAETAMGAWPVDG